MSARESLEQIFRSPDAVLSIKSRPLIMEAVDRLMESIPEEVILEGFDYFIRTFRKDDKQAFELSLLTKDRMIYHLVYTSKKRQFISFPLSEATWVELDTHYADPDTDLFESSSKPYRASLHIPTRTNRILNYSVEGQRHTVRSLINYGQKCVRALHDVKQEETADASSESATS